MTARGARSASVTLPWRLRSTATSRSPTVYLASPTWSGKVTLIRPRPAGLRYRSQAAGLSSPGAAGTGPGG